MLVPGGGNNVARASSRCWKLMRQRRLNVLDHDSHFLTTAWASGELVEIGLHPCPRSPSQKSSLAKCSKATKRASCSWKAILLDDLDVLKRPEGVLSRHVAFPSGARPNPQDNWVVIKRTAAEAHRQRWRRSESRGIGRSQPVSSGAVCSADREGVCRGVSHASLDLIPSAIRFEPGSLGALKGVGASDRGLPGL